MKLKIETRKNLTHAQVALRVFALTIAGGLIVKLWTDYNSHDPGVTELEALGYSLTDLGNRESVSDNYKKHKRKKNKSYHHR